MATHTIYRVIYYYGAEFSGYSYHTNKREAKASAAEYRREFRDVDADAFICDEKPVPKTKKATMAMLRDWAENHSDAYVHTDLT